MCCWQALSPSPSAFQKVIDSLQARKAIPPLSPSVVAEYRAVLLHPAIAAKFARLNTRRVELAIHRLRYVGDEYRSVRVKFEFERDPQDAMFVELAIAGDATHLVTMDSDLLETPRPTLPIAVTSLVSRPMAGVICCPICTLAAG